VVWQVFRERPSAAVGAVIVLIVTIFAIFAPVLAPSGLNQQIGEPFCRPDFGSYAKFLGCDDGGISIVTLLYFGARVTLIVGFAATSLAMVVGCGVRILSRYFGGATDIALMRIPDYFLVIPDIPLMI